MQNSALSIEFAPNFAYKTSAKIFTEVFTKIFTYKTCQMRGMVRILGMLTIQGMVFILNIVTMTRLDHSCCLTVFGLR